MRHATVIAAAVFAGMVCSGAMAVEKPRLNPGVPVEQGPFLDPRTGSYFELRVSKRVHNYWHLAVNDAASLTYKGRQGRLAVIKDPETLDFIRENFRFNEETWIGLRFYCKFRKLVSVTGETHPLRNQMWAPSWHRGENCRTQSQWAYMPILLSMDGRSEAAWQATGPSKVFKSYLVEYPAPPPQVNAPEAPASPASDN